MSEAREIREAMLAALPEAASIFVETPQSGQIYVPRSHLRALSPEAHLVVGARGVGKSFWTAALSDPGLCEVLTPSVSWLRTTGVSVGFGSSTSNSSYPGAARFTQLREKGFSPYDIWRAVVSRWVVRGLNMPDAIPTDSWEATVAWVKDNPEPLDQYVAQFSDMLRGEGRQGLIVFDALDRTGHDWRSMDETVRDLLRVVLWLKSFRAIYAKVFLREDQFGRNVLTFPDASKLLATKAELSWQTHDFHGLLWQYLCNAPGQHGACLRNVYTKVCKTQPLEKAQKIWSPTDEARRNETIQKALFTALAGEWMGKDRRRGATGNWIVNHLADGRQQTSPRSFLAAIWAAADHSMEKYPDHEYALHYESIKHGVRAASQIRVSEMGEDYAWVRTLCQPLSGLSVPCKFEEDVCPRWEIVQFPQGQLPPPHDEWGKIGYRDDLRDLGVFDIMRDGRINMPDLYRIGFGLGRRGGVRPVRRMDEEASR